MAPSGFESAIPLGDAGGAEAAMMEALLLVQAPDALQAELPAGATVKADEALAEIGADIEAATVVDDALDALVGPADAPAIAETSPAVDLLAAIAPQGEGFANFEMPDPLDDAAAAADSAVA